MSFHPLYSPDIAPSSQIHFLYFFFLTLSADVLTSMFTSARVGGWARRGGGGKELVLLCWTTWIGHEEQIGHTQRKTEMKTWKRHDRERKRERKITNGQNWTHTHTHTQREMHRLEEGFQQSTNKPMFLSDQQPKNELVTTEWLNECIQTANWAIDPWKVFQIGDTHTHSFC